MGASTSRRADGTAADGWCRMQVSRAISAAANGSSNWATLATRSSGIGGIIDGGECRPSRSCDRDRRGTRGWCNVRPLRRPALQRPRPNGWTSGPLRGRWREPEQEKTSISAGFLIYFPGAPPRFGLVEETVGGALGLPCRCCAPEAPVCHDPGGPVGDSCEPAC
jgi:hypothetical protein